jgi:hypothetical protein
MLLLEEHSTFERMHSEQGRNGSHLLFGQRMVSLREGRRLTRLLLRRHLSHALLTRVGSGLR